MSEYQGCSDGNCLLRLTPLRQHTNGGCRCLRDVARPLRHAIMRKIRSQRVEIERLMRELAVVNAQSEWRLKNAENTRRWADFVVERLRAALEACRKYAAARLTDDPNDGLALVIEKVVSGRMGPLRDQAEGGE